MRIILIILLLLGISKFSYAVSFLNYSEEPNAFQTKKLKKDRDGTFQKGGVSKKSHAPKKLSSAEFENELSKRNEFYDSQLSKKMDAFYSGPIVIENYHKIRPKRPQLFCSHFLDFFDSNLLASYNYLSSYLHKYLN